MNTKILNGDCIEMMRTLPEKSINCCVTSPPYFGLRDYGHEGQIGLEETPDAFVQKLVEVFREVKRVLKDDGTLWINLGDCYDSKTKQLLGIPWRVAFALQSDGWILRSDIIWNKPNGMPQGPQIKRPTTLHEYIFFFTKNKNYFYDVNSIRQPHKTNGVSERMVGGVKSNAQYSTPAGNNDRIVSTGTRMGQNPLGKNRGSVWTVNTIPYSEAHFATFPPELIRPCILAGCPKGGVVLDPFGGSGTTASVANEEGRDAILCELNPDYIPLINKRLSEVQPKLF